MSTRERFAIALRRARRYAGLTQEDFAVTSSRTYVSMLERGVRSPTLDKVEELAGTLGLHPLALLTLTYLGKHADDAAARKLLREVESTVGKVLNDGTQ